MNTMREISAEITRLISERDAALKIIFSADENINRGLFLFLEDRIFEFYKPKILELEARFQVAEYWQSQAAPNNKMQLTGLTPDEPAAAGETPGN